MTDAYRRAGVDLDAAARAVDRIREIAASASRPEVVEGIGGFAGLFRVGEGRLLAAATDGVGTKLEVARAAGRLDTIGIDLVAMCANDVVCTGAEPILFLDYVASGIVDPEEIATVVAGVAEGCRRAGCALLGGETAEHPGVLEPGRLDLAGFCVGIVDEGRVLGSHRVEAGDVLVALPSSGLHANGFSLVRRAVEGLHLDRTPEDLGRPLVEELLEPTAIYVRPVLGAVAKGDVHAAAHVTGGGLIENVPRALGERFGAEIRAGSWDVPAVFGFVQRLSGADDEEMFRTFNMGVGMVLAVAPGGVSEVLETVGGDASVVGEVSEGSGVTIA